MMKPTQPNRTAKHAKMGHSQVHVGLFDLKPSRENDHLEMKAQLCLNCLIYSLSYSFILPASTVETSSDSTLISSSASLEFLSPNFIKLQKNDHGECFFMVNFEKNPPFCVVGVGIGTKHSSFDPDT